MRAQVWGRWVGDEGRLHGLLLLCRTQLSCRIRIKGRMMRWIMRMRMVESGSVLPEDDVDDLSALLVLLSLSPYHYSQLFFYSFSLSWGSIWPGRFWCVVVFLSTLFSTILVFLLPFHLFSRCNISSPCMHRLFLFSPRHTLSFFRHSSPITSRMAISFFSTTLHDYDIFFLFHLSLHYHDVVVRSLQLNVCVWCIKMYSRPVLYWLLYSLSYESAQHMYSCTTWVIRGCLL